MAKKTEREDAPAFCLPVCLSLFFLPRWTLYERPVELVLSSVVSGFASIQLDGFKIVARRVAVKVVVGNGAKVEAAGAVTPVRGKG